MALNLEAEEENLSSDTEVELPLQVPKVSSSFYYYSGSKYSLPNMCSNCFTYVFPREVQNCYGSVFIESPATFSFSEYDFGSVFEQFEEVELEFVFPFYDLFQCILNFKWYSYDLEYAADIDTDNNTALCTFPNIDYWPPILAWFARQCLSNSISFFDNVKLRNNEAGEYGTIFA
ncbi:ORF8 [Psittacine adenovirus 2]|uniref:ORF8 n=1 Tax=Psittacine adenovirus 2 TaxID=1301246 RepID=A0ABX8SPD9_9ADEN|nr:ORF8 [Psittacine adenovirus 2]QZW33262.1 ORF23 hypothetical protein [Psittacine siadenovirus F]QZW33708.1 ORF23 hypothetical protein [Psittacine adenovirus 2]WGL41031.1 hypothetical protein [Psittacine siadenovirus F]WGL41056.1 hypothetical protein [Psittacine siadenovirus F]